MARHSSRRFESNWDSSWNRRRRRVRSMSSSSIMWSIRTMSNEKALRAQLVKLLDFKEAHVDFDRAVKGIPPRLRGQLPQGTEHSLWQLIEHLRIAQAD